MELALLIVRYATALTIGGPMPTCDHFTTRHNWSYNDGEEQPFCNGSPGGWLGYGNAFCIGECDQRVNTVIVEITTYSGRVLSTQDHQWRLPPWPFPFCLKAAQESLGHQFKMADIKAKSKVETSRDGKKTTLVIRTTARGDEILGKIHAAVDHTFCCLSEEDRKKLLRS